MKRRHFIKTATTAATVPLVIGHMPAHAHTISAELAAVTAADQPTNRVLVLIFLEGGNDGLNTIIPRDQYTGLMAARPKVAIPESKVLALTDKVGVHPSMPGLKNLYQEGKIGIVQGVHSANPNGSHFEASNVMFSGLDSVLPFQTGWAGRYLDNIFPGYPQDYPNPQMPDPLAITLGGLSSGILQGPFVNTSLAVRDPAALGQLVNGPSDPVPNTPRGHEVKYLRQVIASLNAYSTSLKNATTKAKNLSTKYPANNYLAEQFKIVAQLVAGGLQTRIYVCNYGGFDTHGGQVDASDSTKGHHANLLQGLSEALAGFQDDLKLLGIQDRVVGMTVSEFGRRVYAGAGLGTDHGEAGPMILFGTNINPTIHGHNPDISGTDKEYVRLQYDFRTIYTSILQDWFNVAPDTLKQLFPSQDTPNGFPYLPVIKTSTPPPIPGIGNGLTSQYYNGMNFDTLRLTRIDPTVDFNWGANAPDASVQGNQFSVRWSGQVKPRYSGEYTFYVNSDNGRRLWINGQLIIDGWVNDWNKEYSGKSTLTANQLIDIKLEYFDDIGAASVKLEWQSASQSREVIPKACLFSQVSTLANGTYRLMSKSSRKYIDVYGQSKAAEAILHQWALTGNLNQQWQIENLGSNYLKLTAAHSGRVMDVAGLSMVEGATIYQWDWKNSQNQRFKLTDVGGGYYSLTAQHSGKCVQVAAKAITNAARIVQGTYLGEAHQQWQFERLSPARMDHTEESITLGNQVQLYPNPADQAVTISWEGIAQQTVYLSVANLAGVVVYEQAVYGSQQVVDTAQLKEGIYVVTVRNGSSVVTKKLLVNR
ncbi:MAG: RICIN domain-containing protein [Bacteroidota bacterium]